MFFVHLMHKTVFTQPFIDFFGKYFDEYLHSFFVLQNPNFAGEPLKGKNVYSINDNFCYDARSVDVLKQGKKIFLHGMFKNGYPHLLMADPSLAKRANWIIWGGDLYDIPAQGQRAEAAKLFEGIVTFSEKDYEVACEKYHVTGRHFENFAPMTKSLELMEKIYNSRPRVSGKTNILIGHSASRSLMHREMFELVHAKFEHENFSIYSTLSYGDQEYAKDVDRLGRKMFGEKFIPLFKFMSADQYTKFLSRIDVALFPQFRNQAGSNTMELLFLGKKVFLHGESGIAVTLRKLGIHIDDIDDVKKLSFQEFSFNEHAQQNHDNSIQLYDGTLAKKIWLKNLFG